MATVVERSRISDRFPGSRRVRVSVEPSASFTVKQTVPTGFSGVPPPGPAIPVIATAVSAPKRCSAPVGHRLGDGFGHRAVCFDQGGVDAEQLGLRLVGIGSPRRRSRSRTNPAGRSAAPPPARRCRIRPSLSGGRTATVRPDRRPASRLRRRSAVRAGRAAAASAVHRCLPHPARSG